MDEPLFLPHERTYFGRVYLKVRDKQPLDKHESAFLVQLVIRSQKNCLQARIERDTGRQSVTVFEATRRVKETYRSQKTAYDVPDAYSP